MASGRGGEVEATDSSVSPRGEPENHETRRLLRAENEAMHEVRPLLHAQKRKTVSKFSFSARRTSCCTHKSGSARPETPRSRPAPALLCAEAVEDQARALPARAERHRHRARAAPPPAEHAATRPARRAATAKGPRSRASSRPAAAEGADLVARAAETYPPYFAEQGIGEEAPAIALGASWLQFLISMPPMMAKPLTISS